MLSLQLQMLCFLTPGEKSSTPHISFFGSVLHCRGTITVRFIIIQIERTLIKVLSRSTANDKDSLEAKEGATFGIVSSEESVEWESFVQYFSFVQLTLVL